MHLLAKTLMKHSERKFHTTYIGAGHIILHFDVRRNSIGSGLWDIFIWNVTPSFITI